MDGTTLLIHYIQVHFLYSMHILPSSHGNGLYEHDLPRKADANFIDYGMIEHPNPNDVSWFLLINVYCMYMSRSFLLY